MSFDPLGQPSDYQPPPGQPLPAGQGSPYEAGPNPQARERLMLPGVFLLAIGVLNLLASLFFAANSATSMFASDEMLEKSMKDQLEMMKQMFPAMKDQLEQEMAKKTPAEMRRQSLLVGAAITIPTFLASLVVLLGGVGMIRSRWYGLCMVASIVAAIPCVSPTGCCCIGNGVGIWALVVLLNPDVRSVFR